MKLKRGFASDNSSGVHPNILAAIGNANSGHVPAYGNDPFTEKASAKFRELFGSESEVFFVFSGTGANVLSIAASTRSFNAVICAQTAHINEDETGAPEKFSGCKLLGIETPDGKITPALIEPKLAHLGNVHHSQPSLISISETTEYGTLYTVDEVRTLAHFAHANGMALHVDGARLSNAAVALDVSFKDLITDTGVDVLSFGGTKNGMIYGEAVVFLNQAHGIEGLSRDFQYLRKNGLQLASKMRFISAQFDAFLTDDLWKETATHSNKMAQLLYKGIKKISSLEVTQSVQANALFVKIPQKCVPPLQKDFAFYVWKDGVNDSRLGMCSEVRWMTSFDTTPEDIEAFVMRIKEVVS